MHYLHFLEWGEKIWLHLYTFFSAEFIPGTVEIDWPEQSMSFNSDKEDI